MASNGEPAPKRQKIKCEVDPDVANLEVRQTLWTFFSRCLNMQNRYLDVDSATLCSAFPLNCDCCYGQACIRH
jgi:hypothetical protein